MYHYPGSARLEVIQYAGQLLCKRGYLALALDTRTPCYNTSKSLNIATRNLRFLKLRGGSRESTVLNLT